MHAPMLRTQLNEALKTALREKDQVAISTIRLILAAIKDRDIAARGQGKPEIAEAEILALLQTMVKQRAEAIELYERGGRMDLCQQEQAEVQVIERFLPAQVQGAELDAAVDEAIDEIGARSIKDMGQTMALLRERFVGRMDFAAASARVKERLAG